MGKKDTCWIVSAKMLDCAFAIEWVRGSPPPTLADPWVVEAAQVARKSFEADAQRHGKRYVRNTMLELTKDNRTIRFALLIPEMIDPGYALALTGGYAQ